MRLPFSSSVRMIYRIHGNTTYFGAPAHPSETSTHREAAQKLLMIIAYAARIVCNGTKRAGDYSQYSSSRACSVTRRAGDESQCISSSAFSVSKRAGGYSYNSTITTVTTVATVTTAGGYSYNSSS